MVPLLGRAHGTPASVAYSCSICQAGAEVQASIATFTQVRIGTVRTRP
jgi:hypothetical protein